MTFLPSEAPMQNVILPHLFIYTSFPLSVFEPLMYVGSLALSWMWGSPVYVCTYIWLLFLANLPHVDLIIRPAGRTLREKGSFFLTHMTKGTITKNRINWHHVSLDIINWERHIISAKNTTNSYWETFYTTRLELFKNERSWKTKKCSKLKDSKKIWQIN